MYNNFNSELFRLAQESPALQDIFLNALANYSIPTGNIKESVFDMEDPNKVETIVKAINQADSLTVAQLDKMAGELRVALTLEEVKGRELLPYEKTLKDIDISALAVFIVVKWLNARRQTNKGADKE